MKQSTSPRIAAARALGRAAEQYPDLPPVSLHTSGLDPRDIRLGLAIQRTALQRWLTIEHLLNAFLRQPMGKLEPRLRGLLLAAGAQLLFMRLPAHAVVDETVRIARQQIRPGAAPLCNAVLRRLAQVPRKMIDEPWALAADRVPMSRDQVLTLDHPRLPDPEKQLAHHLGVATSHPTRLVRHWLETHGQQGTAQLCCHNILNPPTIVMVEPGFDRQSPSPDYQPHAEADAIVWQGAYDKLPGFLADNPHRRVQDPAAARPVRSAARLSPKVIVDYCAGRGTKTRQLALQHPDAAVIACDPNTDRMQDLRSLNLPNVTAVLPHQVPEALSGRSVDLLLLDVPCSNTAVLARRPEARYRYSPQSVASVVHLQRQIVEESLPLVRPGGHVLYVTCSLLHEENQAQARWLARLTGGELLHDDLLLPAGQDATYHDGSYHALIRL